MSETDDEITVPVEKDHPNKGSTLLRLSLEERQSIEKGLKLKLSTGTIASTLGRSHSCVKQEILRNGGRLKYNANESQERFLIRERNRRLKISKSYSIEETEKLKNLINEQNLCVKEIMEKTGMSDYRIRGFANKNKLIIRNKSFRSFDDKFQSIEMQIDLMFDVLREIQKKLNS